MDIKSFSADALGPEPDRSFKPGRQSAVVRIAITRQMGLSHTVPTLTAWVILSLRSNTGPNLQIHQQLGIS